MFFSLGYSVFSPTSANNPRNATLLPRDVRLSFGRRRPQRGVGRPEERDNCQVRPLFPSPSTPTHTHPRTDHKPSTRRHYLLTTDENNENDGETTTITGRTTTIMGRMTTTTGRTMTTTGRTTTKITTRAKRTGTSHPNELTPRKMTERRQRGGPHGYGHHHHRPQPPPRATARGVKTGSNGEGDGTASRQ
jgi:hypothetical protein